MSTRYWLVDSEHKKRITVFAETLRGERDASIARLTAWGEAHKCAENVDDCIMDRLEEAIQELKRFPATVDMSYIDTAIPIGRNTSGGFQWDEERRFTTMGDVQTFMAQHPAFVIEDEYGTEYTAEKFAQEIRARTLPKEPNPTAAKAPTQQGEIVIKHGDILTSGANIIVQQVNCMGVMGSGLAKAIRAKYPRVYAPYRALCEANTSRPASLLGHCQFIPVSPTCTIANCFGQVEYGRNEVHTDYVGLRQALTSLRKALGDGRKVAFPYKLGCGLGGGSWRDVLAIIDDLFGDYTGDVEIWSIDGETEFILYDPAVGYFGQTNTAPFGSDVIKITNKYGAYRFRSEKDALKAKEKIAQNGPYYGFNFQCIEA